MSRLPVPEYTTLEPSVGLSIIQLRTNKLRENLAAMTGKVHMEKHQIYPTKSSPLQSLHFIPLTVAHLTSYALV